MSAARIIFVNIDTKRKVFDSDNSGQVPRRGEYVRHHECLYDLDNNSIGIKTKWYRVVMIVNDYETVLINQCPKRNTIVFVSPETELGEDMLEKNTGLQLGEDPFYKYGLNIE